MDNAIEAEDAKSIAFHASLLIIFLQGNLIAVDPETFEVVRQIQALRHSVENNKDSDAADGTTTSTDGGATANSSKTTAAGAPRNAVEALSDEKLINLFLLMARGSNWAGVDKGGPGQGSSGKAAGVGGGGGAVGDSGAPEGGGGEEEVMGGVEAMFAVAAPSVSSAASLSQRVHAVSGGVASGPTSAAAAAGGAANDDDDAVVGLAAQMSIDDGTPPSVTVTPPPVVSDTNGDVRSGGVSMRDVAGGGGEDGHVWGEMQLARRHEDKVRVSCVFFAIQT